MNAKTLDNLLYLIVMTGLGLFAAFLIWAGICEASQIAPTEKPNPCIQVANDARYYRLESYGRGMLLDSITPDVLQVLEKINAVKKLENDLKVKEGRK